jgi:hypothetical protein
VRTLQRRRAGDERRPDRSTRCRAQEARPRQPPGRSPEVLRGHPHRHTTAVRVNLAIVVDINVASISSYAQRSGRRADERKAILVAAHRAKRAEPHAERRGCRDWQQLLGRMSDEIALNGAPRGSHAGERMTHHPVAGVDATGDEEFAAGTGQSCGRGGRASRSLLTTRPSTSPRDRAQARFFCPNQPKTTRNCGNLSSIGERLLEGGNPLAASDSRPLAYPLYTQVAAGSTPAPPIGAQSPGYLIRAGAQGRAELFATRAGEPFAEARCAQSLERRGRRCCG